MGRRGCCEKMGLKKGPWSHDEDRILISYIQQHGHPNWRALPKHAGLFRCGKSCRLRWINYLRPDIKRGNFSKEEEETIMNLHEMLGNRWSVIATKLPGRTDNEIKNVWHTHLKKKLQSHQTNARVPKRRHTGSECTSSALHPEEPIVSRCRPVQPERNPIDKQKFTLSKSSSSESSSITEMTTNLSDVIKLEEIDQETFLDDSFWSETLSGEDSNNMMESDMSRHVPAPGVSVSLLIDVRNPSVGSDINGMDLWYDIFTHVEELPELPEF